MCVHFVSDVKSDDLDVSDDVLNVSKLCTSFLFPSPFIVDLTSSRWSCPDLHPIVMAQLL